LEEIVDSIKTFELDKEFLESLDKDVKVFKEKTQ